MADIKNTGQNSIMADEMVDKSGTKQVSIFLRWLDGTFETHKKSAGTEQG